MDNNGNDYRGPRLGDAASLWNFSPSPGWTKTEVAILRLCLMVHGVGRWREIEATGLLPGKLYQQLNGQTQRLLGQQSLAAYTGLKVDIDRIRQDNAVRADVERKAGLIIWSGPNPTIEMKAQWQAEARQQYSLSEEQIAAAEQQLEEVAAMLQHNRHSQQQQQQPVQLPDSLMAEDPAQLSRGQKLALLQRLRDAMKQMHAQLLLRPAQEQSDERNGGAGPLQDVSNGAHRMNSSAVAVRKQRAHGGAKRSRSGGVIAPAPKQDAGSKPQRGSKRKARGSGQGRRSGDVHEAPLNDIAAEAREAAMGCDIAHLQAMGFDMLKAREALEETECDVDAAIEWLLASCV